MQDTLGLTGGARCVEDEQRVLGAHHLGLTLLGCLRRDLVIPVVAAVDPADVRAGRLDHDHGVHMLVL